MIKCFQKVLEFHNSGKPSVLLTVIQKNGDGPCSVGAKLLVSNDGSTFGTVGGGNVEFLAIKHALKLFATKKSDLLSFDMNPITPSCEPFDLNQVNELFPLTVKTGMFCGGSATIFFEYISNSLPTYIFGAGHIGQALCAHLIPLGFSLNLLDSREEYLTPINECNNILVDYNDVFQNFQIPKESFVIIATPSHIHDYDVLKAIYKNNYNPTYIGLVASKKKVAILKEKLKEDFGDSIDISNLFMPAGIHTGGNTPHEIAISIIAQMLSVKHSISGNKHMGV